MSFDIAVIGADCVFPRANGIEEFFNLITSNESAIVDVSSFCKDTNSSYIPFKGVISNPFMFDAKFFGFSNRDAQILDPQHRIFFQTAYNAIEIAGYDPKNMDKKVGVFASCGFSGYLYNHLLKNDEVVLNCDQLYLQLLNDKDFLSTRFSYLMDFVGPSMTVQAGCSSSLLAIHLSVQSLLLQECDVAVAGGVSISYPINSGYIYQEGSITSKDGRICSFDENATGTVRGDGCGVVILKRLDDALKDEDNILSIIKGTATTNDGKNKIGFTAPGLQQQINVIGEAIISSECDLNDIDFVEAHGTGTKIGDPIEIRAISEVFKNKKSKIAITSVKPHIGHLDVASGIASFIKTCICLKNNIIPHTLNFKNINPMIKPFCEKIEILKNIKYIPYAEKRVITAGVTSLGMGGTNVHVILQSANQNIDKKIGIRRRKFNTEEFVIYPSAIKEIYDKDMAHKENNTECYEEAINKAWRMILGKDNIKLTDNFFDLGGNSFSAIQCITFLNDKITFKLDVIDFFSNPTLGGFIKYVKDRING